MIKAEIVAHSLSPQGDELISVLCTFPRIILAEVNTHRMLSKNTSSSRAIPFNKMVEAIESNPFIPIAWQKSHSGMQGSEYFTEEGSIFNREEAWKYSLKEAIKAAKALDKLEVTKQLANRLLEPFMWTTMLITGPRSGWENFFKLRCPQYEVNGEYYNSKEDALTIVIMEDPDFYSKMSEASELEWLQINKGQAEIHIMDLAEKIWDALGESKPKKLKAGEWHIPFHSKIDTFKLEYQFGVASFWKNLIKVSVALAARTSYTIVGDEKEINYEKMVGLHDKLLSQDPPHSSPLEHCARAMTDDEYYLFNRGKASIDTWSKSVDEIFYTNNNRGWCNNFKGFIQYRYLIDNGIVI